MIQDAPFTLSGEEPVYDPEQDCWVYFNSTLAHLDPHQPTTTSLASDIAIGCYPHQSNCKTGINKGWFWSPDSPYKGCSLIYYPKAYYRFVAALHCT